MSPAGAAAAPPAWRLGVHSPAGAQRGAQRGAQQGAQPCLPNEGGFAEACQGAHSQRGHPPPTHPRRARTWLGQGGPSHVAATQTRAARARMGHMAPSMPQSLDPPTSASICPPSKLGWKTALVQPSTWPRRLGYELWREGRAPSRLGCNDTAQAPCLQIPPKGTAWAMRQCWPIARANAAALHSPVATPFPNRTPYPHCTPLHNGTPSPICAPYPNCTPISQLHPYPAPALVAYAPSCTTYSLPCCRHLPAALTAASVPSSFKSEYLRSGLAQGHRSCTQSTHMYPHALRHHRPSGPEQHSLLTCARHHRPSGPEQRSHNNHFCAKPEA